ncbi:type III-B CRISPR module RAMP protein Cmr4 [Candidatus Acidulodesulfobacterium sp. H_13]|uniref:type III-B CRISPR module RAMP protein Cmr4 n=1 Tax=Candidatus Acidulodesulfobacterium sp. H_13 TaxID=3395470 RepID=UPI003AF597DE
MYKIAMPFFMIVETPLHAGSGTELGIVDMPIQRERHTGFPKIEGSGLKGSIREVFEESTGEISVGSAKVNNENRKESISLAFGPENGDAHAGALGFTDARLLLFPVKSMKGVFAWITCPMVLKKFKEDLKLCNICFKQDINDIFDIIALLSNSLKIADGKGKCLVSDREEVEINGNIILEEYAFEILNNDIKKLAEFLSNHADINEIKNKLVVLSDDDFRDFVNLSTEVITRTKINNETGTVQPGALFTEEYLPTETVMYSLALTTPIFNKEKGIFKETDNQKEEVKVMKFFECNIPEVMQIGGNATIGKGIVRMVAWENKNE